MSDSVPFVLIATAVIIGLSALGSLALWYRHRKPRNLEYGVDEFQRELKALAPERREGD